MNQQEKKDTVVRELLGLKFEKLKDLRGGLLCLIPDGDDGDIPLDQLCAPDDGSDSPPQRCTCTA